MSQIRTPAAVVNAQLDAIQKQTERNFQDAYIQINRAKARLFWEAGYRQCMLDLGLDKPIFTPSEPEKS